MLISGDRIRLSSRELNQLSQLTQCSVSHLRTKTQLNSFVREQLANQPDSTPEEKLIHKMLESFLT